MKRLKKYSIFLFLIVPFLAFFSTTTTGCDPHRRGATVKPMGGAGGKKYHTRPASAKRRRKSQY